MYVCMQKASASAGIVPRPLPGLPHWGLPSPELPDFQMFILDMSWGKPTQKKIKIRRDQRTRGTNSLLDDTDKKMLVPVCLYCLNCTKFGQLILGKIIKIVATRCQSLRLKYTKFDFGWGSAPDPAGESTALPRPPSWN